MKIHPSGFLDDIRHHQSTVRDTTRHDSKNSKMCLPCFSFSNAQYERGNRSGYQYQYVWNGQTWVLRDTVSGSKIS